MKIANLGKDTLIIISSLKERKRIIALFKTTNSPIPRNWLPNDKCPNIYMGLFNHRALNTPDFVNLPFYKKIKSQYVK